MYTKKTFIQQENGSQGREKCWKKNLEKEIRDLKGSSRADENKG